MQTSTPIFNEPLARGMVRRTLRETSHRQALAQQRADDGFAPTRRRRGPIFRALVKYMDSCLEDRVLVREIAGKGKHIRAQWVHWEVASDDEQLRIGLSIVEPRHPYIREGELVRISRHALQRLFQRLRTTDPTEALSELIPVALHSAQLRAKARENGERYHVHLEIPTSLGDAVVVWDDETENFLVKTWIHRDSMHEWRGARHDLALERQEMICC